MSGALRSFLDRLVANNQAPALANQPYSYQVAAGLAGAKASILMCGYDPAPVAAGAPIWVGSSSNYPYPTADQVIKVKSTNVNDDGNPLGTGAQTIRVWWLDSANAEGAVDVIMDGTTLVVTAVATMRRILRAQVLTVGVNGSNVGTINIYGTDGTTVLHAIPIDTGFVTGRGVTDGCFTTVPVGHQDVIGVIGGDQMGIAGDNEWRLVARSGPSAPWRRLWSIRVGDRTPFYVPIDPPVTIPAGSDWGLWSYQGTAGVHGTVFGWREAT